MERVSVISGLVISLFVISGCEKDDDDDRLLGHSGGCNISCQNGGSVDFSDCTCDCPSGFSGSSCQNEMVPSTFRLTRIEITQWPFFNQNDYWDSDLTAPDPRVEINLGTSPFLHTGTILNPPSGATLYYGTANDPTNFPQVLNVNTTYDFRVYDRDGNQSDLMLNSQFKLADFSSGLPTTLSLSTDSEWSFKFYGDWQS